jgi:hypothetical protein
LGGVRGQFILHFLVEYNAVEGYPVLISCVPFTCDTFRVSEMSFHDRFSIDVKKIFNSGEVVLYKIYGYVVIAIAWG